MSNQLQNITADSAMMSQAETDDEVIDLWTHGHSRHTQRAYRANAARFLGFTGKPLALVSLRDIQAFADSLTWLAPSSQGQVLAAVKSLLSFAQRIGYIRFNVGSAVRLPKAKDALAERILQESEVHRMFALEPNRRNQLILRTLYYAGIRVSELCGLRWRDLRPRGSEGQITVFGKGGKTRAILIPPRLWNDLAALREDADEDGPV
ncbi:MAG: tyrosine-type recombinase/integrase, partial [Blastocatellia bacterium]